MSNKNQHIIFTAKSKNCLPGLKRSKILGFVGAQICNHAAPVLTITKSKLRMNVFFVSVCLLLLLFLLLLFFTSLSGG